MNPTSEHVHPEHLPMHILLLHAYPLSAQMWAHESDTLRAAGFRVSTPNYPGFGGREGQCDSLADYARQLWSMLDADRAPLVLGGLSMGGYLVMELLRQATPEQYGRIRGLIFACTRMDADSPAAQLQRDQSAARVQAEGTAWLIAEMLDKQLTAAASPELRADVGQMMAMATPAGIVAALQALKQRPDSSKLLGATSLPSLVIAGQQDPLTPPELLYSLSGLLVRGRYVELSGASHLAPLENVQFAEVVLDFVQQLA